MELNGRMGGGAHVFILTGMSRSGTSMSASLLQAGGAAMGKRQLMAHAGNPKGHFENIDFLDFHREVLRQQGMHDAGWMSAGRVTVPAEREAEARRLIAVNAAAAGPAGWGWKDPRTTLFLDFWNGLIPEAHNILLYRAPWEVVDSIFRRGVSEDFYFRERPEEAVRNWVYYSRCLLDFARRTPGKSVLVAFDAVTANPGAFIGLVNERFGAALQMPPEDIVDAKLLHRHPLDSAWAKLVTRAFPETPGLLEELDAASSLRSEVPMPGAGAEAGVTEDFSGSFHEWFEGYERARVAQKSRLRRWFREWRRKWKG